MMNRVDLASASTEMSPQKLVHLYHSIQARQKHHGRLGQSLLYEVRSRLTTQTSQITPLLPDLISLLESSTSAPSTLAPPSDPTYPSTSHASPTSAPASNGHGESRKPNLVPIYAEIPADLLTPVAAYLKIAHRSRHSFLLESVEGGETVARYSFIGAGASLRNVCCSGASSRVQIH